MASRPPWEIYGGQQSAPAAMPPAPVGQNGPQPFTVGTPRPAAQREAPSGYRWNAAGGLEAIPGGPADPDRPGGPRDPNTPTTRSTRQLPMGAYTTLEQGATGYRDLNRLNNTFNDNFSGIGSGIENWAQGYANVGTPGQRDWWSDLNAADNILRNALFGASLTAGEQAAWERTTVTPGMRPEEIRTNLARRLELANDLLRRRGRSFRANGYSEDAIREALGEYGSLIDDPQGQTADDVRASVSAAAQRQQEQPQAAPPPGTPPQAPPGTEVAFWDDPRAPRPPGADQFQTDVQEALDRGFFTTADDIIRYGRERGFNIRPDQAEAAIRARANGVSVQVAPPTFERPNIDDVRGPDAQGQPILDIVAAPIGGTQGVEALRRGALDTMALGFGDELAAARDTLFYNDDSYGENLYRQRAIDEYDNQNQYGQRLAGQLAGGLALPNFGAQGARQNALVGAGYGGAYGLGSGEGGFNNRVGNALVGATLGGTVGAGAGGIGSVLEAQAANRAARAAPGNALVEAGERQDIPVLPADVGGNVTRRMTGGVAQTVFGGGPIRRAAEASVEAAGAARDRAAGTVGRVAANPEEAGEVARAGARSYIEQSGARGGRMYDRAERLAGETRITPNTAIATLDRNIAELSETPGGAEGLAVLQQLRDELAGDFSIAGVRRMRTALRDRFLTAGLRGSDLERRVGQVIDAAQQDIVTGLQQAGRGNAARAFRQADDFWRQRLQTIDQTLEPIIGRNGERSGEEIVSALRRASKGNTRRLGAFLSALPQEEAATVRASLITQIGRPSAGTDTGATFSFNQFLTHYNEMQPGARRALFGDAAPALDDLATIARGSREASRYANTSGTGGALNAADLIRGASAIGGWSTSGLSSIAEHLTGRLLASPGFARWLTRAARSNPRAAGRSLSSLVSRNPAIAQDVLPIQHVLAQSANDNVGGAFSRAAADSGSTGRDDRNQH